MTRILVDANLPQTFNLWQSDDFLYANSLGLDGSDNFLWDYAKQNSLTILSRNKDFADRMIHSNPPPKVIHFRLGNIRYFDFREFIKEHWEKIYCTRGKKVSLNFGGAIRISWINNSRYQG